MKKWKGIIICLVAINFVFFRCERDATTPTIKGKLVYRSCASAVVQIRDSAYFNFGQASWQMSPSSPVYNNVFKVGNHCKFGSFNIVDGQEFYFKPINQTDRDCVICMLWDNPPTTALNIEVVP
jgi:hypothetical protein